MGRSIRAIHLNYICEPPSQFTNALTRWGLQDSPFRQNFGTIRSFKLRHSRLLTQHLLRHSLGFPLLSTSTTKMTGFVPASTVDSAVANIDDARTSAFFLVDRPPNAPEPPDAIIPELEKMAFCARISGWLQACNLDLIRVWGRSDVCIIYPTMY